MNETRLEKRVRESLEEDARQMNHYRQYKASQKIASYIDRQRSGSIRTYLRGNPYKGEQDGE